MSIESPVPRTAVPLGITDPVESARAELKAALSAIEEKTNVPKQVARKKKAAANRAKRESKNVGGRWEGRGGVGCAACRSASCCCDRRVALCAPAWLPVSQLLPSLFPLLCTPQVPNLIFQIEEFERLLIRISKTGEALQYKMLTVAVAC